MKKAYFNWSSGKDANLALFKVLNESQYEISKLVTTVNTDYDRVSMHGLRTSLLNQQAEAIGISLLQVGVSKDVSMVTYDAIMKKTVQKLLKEGYEYAFFGDIFLEDLKQYREKMLSPYGIQSVFPLWKRDTKELIHEFLELGFKAVIVCINNSKLDDSFLGQELSKELIDRLPKDVDPCGENGEFHTFCFDGPIFANPIGFEIGEKVYKTYDNPMDKTKNIKFGFCDLKLK